MRYLGWRNSGDFGRNTVLPKCVCGSVRLQESCSVGGVVTRGYLGREWRGMSMEYVMDFQGSTRLSRWKARSRHLTVPAASVFIFFEFEEEGS